MLLALILAVTLISAATLVGAASVDAVDNSALMPPPPGSEDVGLVDTVLGQWHLRDSATGRINSFAYGNPGDVPFTGDWDCDGDETPGLYRQSDGLVYLRNSNSQGVADVSFILGNPSDVPLAGDFNGDGCDTVSAYRPSTQQVFVINKLGAGGGVLRPAEISYVLGNPGDKPFVGDFDGDGTDSVGLHQPSTGRVYLRNSHTTGFADADFVLGNPLDRMIAGDWNSNGLDSPAVFRPLESRFYFPFTSTQGFADAIVSFGASAWQPVAGDFDTTTTVPPATSSILWSAGHESGSTEEWSYIAISGNANAAVSSQRAHTGSYANRLTIIDADGSGSSPGVRMEKHKDLPGYGEVENLPREGYYSVYYYFPEYVSHNNWFWNVFQWKRGYIKSDGGQSRHPTWVVNVLDSGPDRMTFMLERKVDDNNKYLHPGSREATAPIDIPIGQWVHLECYYKWSLDADGRVTCWQDGVEIWDLQNLETDMDYPYLKYPWQWTANNYAGDTTPTTHSIWIDDAAISLQRLGPNWK